MKRLLDWRLLTALFVLAFAMTLTSCGVDDEVKPDMEQVTDGSTENDQGNSGSTGNEETNGSEDNTEGDSGNTDADLENPNGGVAVDLGLPSGTLWADRNIGADTPEECGDYFAWGETEPKAIYSWSTYKWCNGGEETQIKYCSDSEYGLNGFTDNKTTLDAEDDAATANWGDAWCMPTKAQLQELGDNCTWNFTSTTNDVRGCKVTGPNGNSIFLPAAAYRKNDIYGATGIYGYYRSSSLHESYPCNSWELFFYEKYDYINNNPRCYGYPVRAVVR